MPQPKIQVLVVEDDQLLRELLRSVLADLNYEVTCAHDGFSALVELRRSVPQIILSDLNMAGMSGFEFLSVVRQRFPAIQVVAMSGAYPGADVPAGIAADAFYEKGTSIASMLRVLESMSRPERCQPHNMRHGVSAPIWVPKHHDSSQRPHIVITCPECLRAFPQILMEEQSSPNRTHCVYCWVPIYYAIVQTPGAASEHELQRRLRTQTAAASGLPNIN